MSNLLFPEDKKIIRKVFRFRLMIVTGFGIVALVIVGIVLLVPSFAVFRLRNASYKEADAKAISQIDKQGKEIQGILLDVSQKLAVLDVPATALPMHARLEILVENQTAGISLSRINLLSPTKMEISGTAATRDALIVYTNALEKNPFFTEVDSPISNLIAETNNEFVIKLSHTIELP